MTTSGEPTGVYDLAAQLLACAEAGIEDAPGGAGPVDRSCVVWGDIARDSCECGELYVAIGRQVPSGNFPIEGPGPNTNPRCGPTIWIITYTVEILRCIPIQDDRGNPPTCEALEESARLAAIFTAR